MKEYEVPEIEIQIFDSASTVTASGDAHAVIAGLNGATAVVHVSYNDIISFNSAVN